MQRLELTWIGKYDEPRLEPRILLENPELRCGSPSLSGEGRGGVDAWQGMLIHGDNLLALKALEAEYTGKVKCIYIDPPFNTGARIDSDGKEVGYDDGIEHSIWLTMMHWRLKILHRLLCNEGSLFIHLDDNEIDYCKVILDEIFGRNSFVNRITLDARSPSAFSTVNPGVFKSSEYLLWYSKSKQHFENRSMKIQTDRDTAYNKFIKNRSLPHSEWEFISLKMAFLEFWNTNRLPIIIEFVNLVFEKGKALSKPDLKQFIQNKFWLHATTDSSKLANYLHKKLKDIGSSKEFYESVYPYLLEKCSIFFNPTDIDHFVFDNAESVCRETEISDEGAGKETVDMKYESMKNPDFVHCIKRDKLDDIYVLNGKQISFYSKNVEVVDGVITATKLLTNIWTDISWEGIANEGNVKFKKGKKPERLIKRCFELTTNPGDLVLDSFLGSGTTAAAAHKMGRRWIGIELGGHAYTHCVPRLQKVVRGEDQGGISKAVGWRGGGGFRVFSLAPTLLREDRFGQLVINPEYNAPMLAAAVCRHEGFRYDPEPVLWWKQGRGAGRDYLLATTQHVTRPLLDAIHEEMQEGETLLICCRAYDRACTSAYPDITLRKIPNMLFERCEWGRDDYSLHIVPQPGEDKGENSEPAWPLPETPEPPREKTKKAPFNPAQGELF